MSLFSHSASTCLGKIFEARSQITWDLVGFITYNRTPELLALFSVQTFITLGPLVHYFAISICPLNMMAVVWYVIWTYSRGKQQLGWPGVVCCVDQ